MSWGVRPAGVLGHSLGEYAAACIAGVLSLPDALKMVVARAEAMQSTDPAGEMWAIMAPEAIVVERLAGSGQTVSIAAINGPQQIVVSGRSSDVRTIAESFRKEGVAVTQLQVSHAFHSPLVEPALDRFEAAIQKIEFKLPRMTLVSNVSGARPWVGEVGQAAYWRRHMRSPVRFMAGMQALADKGCRLFVEIGPQPVLSVMSRHFLDNETFTWLPSLNRRKEEWRCILDTLTDLHLKGICIDWHSFDAPFQRSRVPLPSGRLERRRYWFTEIPGPVGPDNAKGPKAPGAVADGVGHPLLNRRLDSATGRVTFRASTGSTACDFFKEHRVAGERFTPHGGRAGSRRRRRAPS